MRLAWFQTALNPRNVEAQRESLTALGCERIHEEQTSSVGLRESLRVAMDYSREGDTIVVTKLDRLARSRRWIRQSNTLGLLLTKSATLIIG